MHPRWRLFSAPCVSDVTEEWVEVREVSSLLKTKQLRERGRPLKQGVYFSAAGGAESGWHYDNNHNVTIQLYGTKDWHTVTGGNPNVISSRGMGDEPR